MPKVYGISDTHFGHENIIKYCSRPFESVEEMDKKIIKNWREVITSKDIVLHLGDFGMCTKERAREIMSQLPGYKILIKGNHDHWNDQVYRDIGFNYVSKFPIIYNGFFILSHAPMQLSNTTPYFNLYGHVHNDPNYVNNDTSMCLSVERINYTPKYLFNTDNGEELLQMYLG